ncbi:uncharacterized protein [Rutidosis leptorrhynchoides]|uniref:uncharacterized protein n=1 Tax=Rutidosis leptorrhynchoides TaxID=125765 RepID=UPI003A9A1FE9
MASRFQAVPLVASPTHSNAIAWSTDNLVAVASGHLVTILNPAMPFGPKGLITIPTSKPFPIGVIDRKDLLSGCMLPSCLSRDVRTCARSISWSPLGLAPNAGCLLAVCTTGGVVKVYRSPFCEFSAEWVEVMDISEVLHTYFAKIKYGEAETSSSDDWQPSQLDIEQEDSGGDRPEKRSKNQKQNLQENNNVPLIISAEKYASRSAMLSSLVVAWSPMLHSNSSRSCSILAIGAKSGIISFWRVVEPQCYSITKQNNPPAPALVGFIQAHNSWITAINLSTFVYNGSPHLLLSTGCSDGSVKLWLGCTDDLLKSTEAGHALFSPLKEVINAGSGPVSVLSLFVPDTSPNKIILAVGKGSGSLEILTYDTSINKLEVSGPRCAHDQIVTGLAWAYDGHCLYSCSQDNSLRCWIVKGVLLNEVPLPINILGVKISTDVPNVSDACFGVAISPANLVVAVVRSFDVNLLNPMYQARSQKAAVEFFWIGGQDLQKHSKVNDENFPGYPNLDLVNWGHNILWSLSQYEYLDKPLVLWDIVAALSAFKKYELYYVEQILLKWLTTNLGFEWGPSLGVVSPHIYNCLSNLTSRQLHLINVISRHVILRDAKSNLVNDEEQVSDMRPWTKVLEMCEKELRERLIGCSFSAMVNEFDVNWQPIGLAQMRCWVANNDHVVKDYVKSLVSKFKKTKKRYAAEEECSYCSSTVPFEDTEVAFCLPENCKNGDIQKHKLARCAVSMTVCPLSPSWFCVSCNRWVSNLAPDSLFTLLRYPPNDETEKSLRNVSYSSIGKELSKPLCPFCGVLLQRLQPEFLLSTSHV